MQKDYLSKLLTINTTRLAKTHLRGNYKSSFKGQGIVMSNSRLYQAGDAIRSIDRRTTAKKGEVYVKEYEEERQLQLLFAVDVAASMGFTTTGTTKLAVAQQIVSFVGYVAQQQSNKVGGITFSKNVEYVLRPSQQQASVYQLQQHLILQEKRPLSSLLGAIEAIHHLKIKNTVLLLIADEFIDTSLYHAIAGLAYRHEVLRIQIVDPFEMTLDGDVAAATLVDLNASKTALLYDKTMKTQYQKAFEERYAEQYRFLGNNGADYLLLRTDEDPLLRLAEHFQKKAKRTYR